MFNYGNIMRTTVITVLILAMCITCKGQSLRTVSSVCKEVSVLWKSDSTSCKGDRLRLANLFQNVQSDSISKSFLFQTLGKPNITQKYRQGYPVNKNYMEFIYYIYKDECPQIRLEGTAIGFVFDESETHFIRIEVHDYCG